MGEEFGQGSAVQLFYSMWPSLRPLGGIQLADGLAWRAQDSFTHESATSVGMAGRLDSAGTVSWGANT